MMESEGGASISDVLAHDGKRQSVFRSYVFPLMDRPNLTVLPHALVTRLTFDHKRATGVEIFYDDQTRESKAASSESIPEPGGLTEAPCGDIPINKLLRLIDKALAWLRYIVVILICIRSYTAIFSVGQPMIES
jgi:GMC oxidoreductase